MASTTASQVFNITELAEMILLHADPHELQITLPRVLKQFRNVIIASVKLQRRLHNADHPDWARETMCLVPLSTSTIMWSPYLRGENPKFPYENPPVIPHDGSTYQRNVHFDSGRLNWVCDTTSTDNRLFRSMLICQPPAIAIDSICFSNKSKRTKFGRIENSNGITCGELFDHVKHEAAPVWGQIHLGFSFRQAEDVVSSTP